MRFWDFVLAVLVVPIAACASLPNDIERPVSSAILPSAETTLGKAVIEDGREHQGNSGFALIEAGRFAFTSRIALADLAEKTIDVQYYIWDSDTTGRILAERLLRAADRGVRVRVLIDDLATAGRDSVIATLDVHPNVEIRVFNPFANRGARALDFASDFDRVNHRMHNKMMVFDNAVAIVGGRNIADIYFQVATDGNYRDLDLAVAGPLVRSVSDVFDFFWNSDWATPISALVDATYSKADLDDLSERMRAEIAGAGYPYPIDANAVALTEGLPEVRRQLIWAPGRVIWDNPDDIDRGNVAGNIMDTLVDKAESLQRELLLESPYFVMPDPQVELLSELVSRGVRVRVLTNSLDTNDVIAAHAGHAAHRKDLIRNGIELYELKADAETVEKRIFPMRSRALLHTKALAFDGNSIFVGSFNLDPRSATINTEVGIYVESTELAVELIAYLDEGVAPDSSYRVALDENGDLLWTTEEDGETIVLRKEPGRSFGRRVMVTLIQVLPIEHLL